jgi:hypothetical protein
MRLVLTVVDDPIGRAAGKEEVIVAQAAFAGATSESPVIR